MTVALPPPNAIRDLLAGLVVKQVKVAKCGPLPNAAVRGIATYVSREGELTFAALADLPLLWTVGASLSMIPPAVVAEGLRAKQVSKDILDNAYEVLNIASSLFNVIEEGRRHVKIEKLSPAPPIPPALAASLAKSFGRVDYELGVAGYPDGKLALVALKPLE